MSRIFLIATAMLAIAPLGCEKKPSPPAAARTSDGGAAAKKDDHNGHDHAAGDAHADETSGHKDDGHHSGEVIALGETKIGEWTVRASRDKAEIKPGGEASIDVWVNGGKGEGVTSVRLWIGTADAKGSIKAKADIESDKWHSHTEVPNPMPEDAKLWVEIESAKGEKLPGSFDLKS